MSGECQLVIRSPRIARSVIIRAMVRRVFIFLATSQLAVFAVQTVVAATPAAEQHFETRIRPVLVGKCFKCHGGEKTNN